MILSVLLFKSTFASMLLFGFITLFVVYLFSFFVLQYRVEKFIYRRVKKIYDDVALLESSTIINQPITTDMETLTREVKKFASKAYEKGLTLVPLKMYFKEGRAKVLLGICKGKQKHDKRASIKQRDTKREIDRAMRRR